MHLFFATSNESKAREAQEILSAYIIERIHVDLPEIQGTSEEVAYFKAKEAVRLTGRAVFVEDTGLEFCAWNGLPGPYVKDFLKKMGNAALAAQLTSDKEACAITVVGYCEPGKEPHLFVGRTSGTIVSPKGEAKFGWDPIFVPQGHTKTYAQMSREEKHAVSQRKKALTAFAQFLSQRR